MRTLKIAAGSDILVPILEGDFLSITTTNGEKVVYSADGQEFGEFGLDCHDVLKQIQEAMGEDAVFGSEHTDKETAVADPLAVNGDPVAAAPQVVRTIKPEIQTAPPPKKEAPTQTKTFIQPKKPLVAPKVQMG